GGSVTLTQANNFYGPVGIRTDPGSDAVMVNARALTLGAVLVGRNLTVQAAGPITQTETTAVGAGGTANFSAGTNAITLNGVYNLMRGTVMVSNSGPQNVALVNNTSLVMGRSTVGGNLDVLCNGGITQIDPLTVAGTVHL